MAKRKPGERWRQLGRETKMLNAKKSRRPLIPTRVLQKLASLHLPANEFVYEACLEKLMRES